jgi:hypothetical protein
LQANRFYNAATGEIDFSTLRDLSDRPVKFFPMAIVPTEPRALKGAVGLDGYTFQAEYRPGASLKIYYSPRVTNAAKDRKVFGGEWPPTSPRPTRPIGLRPSGSANW